MKTKPKTKKAVRRVWLVLDTECNYVCEVSLNRSTAIANRNAYFEHDKVGWPIKRLRKVFAVIPATLTYKVSLPRLTKKR